jgi:putative FmdB family regulatory protein
MPIYDYKCGECGKVSEVFQRSLGEPAKCPSCGSENVERIFSASYLIRTESTTPGTTCCGRTERCETPPCSTDDICRRR